VEASRGELETLQKIWELGNNKLTAYEINNKLLLATDHKEMTALHEAAWEGKLGVLLKIREWAGGKLTTEKI